MTSNVPVGLSNRNSDKLLLKNVKILHEIKEEVEKEMPPLNSDHL